MKKGKEFNNILDECLGRILVNGESVDQCLESFPEHAAELEPLLRTAMMTSEAMDIQPSPEFKARARFHLRTEMARVDEKKRRSFFAWQPRWAVVTISVLLVVLLGGSTVLAADSENTLPGNPLYAVKTAVENVRLGLSSSDVARAKLYATLVDRRVAEIDRLIERGKTELAKRAINRMENHLAKMSRLSLAAQNGTTEIAPHTSAVRPEIAEEEQVAPEETTPQEETAVEAQQGASTRALTATAEENRAQLRDLLGYYAIHHPDKLRAILEGAPPSIRPALTRAIIESVASYRKALRELNQPQSDQQPDTSEEKPDSSNLQPDKSDEEPGTSNQQPGTSSLEPETSNQLGTSK